MLAPGSAGHGAASPRQLAISVASTLNCGMGTIGLGEALHLLKHSSRPGSLACQVVRPGSASSREVDDGVTLPSSSRPVYRNCGGSHTRVNK